jgi:hypothetical protein
MYISVRFLVLVAVSFSIGTGAMGDGSEAPGPGDPPLKNGASSIEVADLDGDGTSDVISASTGDGEIAWYPNEGNGYFPEKNVITIGGAGAQDLHVTDLDGDGALDIVGAFGSENTVAWYRNQGTPDAAGAASVHVADLNGDGTPDVLSASQLDGKIAWYANDGSGSFSDQRVISSEGEGARSVYAADLDGDGDPDVVYASSVRAGGSKIAWHRNIEAGFSNQNVLASERRGATSVYASDLDGDGDQDILAAFAELNRGQVAWAENDDANFSAMKVISSEMPGVEEVSTVDLDGDGDEDILSTARVAATDGEISFIRSTAGLFASKSVVATDLAQAWSVAAADLNDSGVPDIVGASQRLDQIAWYKNDLLRGFGFRESTPLGAGI